VHRQETIDTTVPLRDGATLYYNLLIVYFIVLDPGPVLTIFFSFTINHINFSSRIVRIFIGGITISSVTEYISMVVRQTFTSNLTKYLSKTKHILHDKTLVSFHIGAIKENRSVHMLN